MSQLVENTQAQPHDVKPPDKQAKEARRSSGTMLVGSILLLFVSAVLLTFGQIPFAVLFLLLIPVLYFALKRNDKKAAVSGTGGTPANRLPPDEREYTSRA